MTFTQVSEGSKQLQPLPHRDKSQGSYAAAEVSAPSEIPLGRDTAASGFVGSGLRIFGRNGSQLLTNEDPGSFPRQCSSVKVLVSCCVVKEIWFWCHAALLGAVWVKARLYPKGKC